MHVRFCAPDLCARSASKLWVSLAWPVFLTLFLTISNHLYCHSRHCLNARIFLCLRHSACARLQLPPDSCARGASKLWVFFAWPVFLTLFWTISNHLYSHSPHCVTPRNFLCLRHCACARLQVPLICARTARQNLLFLWHGLCS